MKLSEKLTKLRPIAIATVRYLRAGWEIIRRLPGRAWRWYAGQFRGRRWWRKVIAAVVSFFAFIILWLVAVNVNLLWLFGKSPTIHSIMHPQTSSASLIYSADSVMIGKFFNENRTPVAYTDVNPVFYQALIDTEDERFYHHRGIDVVGVVAAIKDIFSGNARGASTLTQQLVKNMFRVRTQYSTGLLGKIPGLDIVIMKSKEWVLAVELEMFYSKEEILIMYVNTVDFGSNAFGIKTAARTYFDVNPSELNTEQSAVLVGLLKATSTYNPRINPKNSFHRRNVVLSNMLKLGHLSKQQYDSISQLPINLKFHVESVYDGQALYFRQALAQELRQWCKDNDIDLYADGLKIYTTIDTRMQRYAEEAVTAHMRSQQQKFYAHWGNTPPWQDEYHREIPDFIEGIARRTNTYKQLQARFPDYPDSIDYYMNKPHPVHLFDYDGGHTDTISSMDSIRYMVKFLHAGLVAMEPNTGHVKAWVGDVDFSTWKYDKVTAQRQPGSTFKLFVYTAAINSGLAPCDRRPDSYLCLQVPNEQGDMEPWVPHNATWEYSDDTLSLRAAFAQSINTIAVRVGMEVGVDNVAQTANSMGIKSILEQKPALCLGASDVNLLELVNGYCTVAADGIRRDPVLVTRIENANGKVIYTAPDNSVQAIPYRSAFLMQHMLMAGLREYNATSLAMWSYIGPFTHDTDFGGKTGSSSNYSDAWYIGVTPNLVAGVWVGGEYRCIHFRTSDLGQGSRSALPLCGNFLNAVLSDPQLSQYRCRFGEPKEDIPLSDYSCPYCHKPETDSVQSTFGADSLLLLDSMEVIFHDDEDPFDTSAAHDDDPLALP